MATFQAQLTEIEFLVRHGKPRARRQGIQAAQSLFASLAKEKQTLESSLVGAPEDSPELAARRASIAQLESHMNDVSPFRNSP